MKGLADGVEFCPQPVAKPWTDWTAANPPNLSIGPGAPNVFAVCGGIPPNPAVWGDIALKFPFCKPNWLKPAFEFGGAWVPNIELVPFPPVPVPAVANGLPPPTPPGAGANTPVPKGLGTKNKIKI